MCMYDLDQARRVAHSTVSHPEDIARAKAELIGALRNIPRLNVQDDEGDPHRWIVEYDSRSSGTVRRYTLSWQEGFPHTLAIRPDHIPGWHYMEFTYRVNGGDLRVAPSALNPSGDALVALVLFLVG